MTNGLTLALTRGSLEEGEAEGEGDLGDEEEGERGEVLGGDGDCGTARPLAGP